jgi:LAO/AO transport system kinase
VAHRAVLEASGALAERRSGQQLHWMWSLVEDRLMLGLRSHAGVRELLPELEARVRDGSLPPTLAALRILDRFTG